MFSTYSFPQPTTCPEYIWRPARKEDAPAIFQFLLDIDAHDGRQWAGTLSDMEKEFDDPDVRVETDTLIALTPDGLVAANTWIIAPPEPGEEYLAYLWIDIHPEHRDTGLGDFMLNWAEARGRQILAERPHDRPHILRVGCMDFERYRRDLVDRHGFSIIRHFFTMRRDLSRPIAEVVLPKGIEITSWRPDLDQCTFEAFDESFQDHWGYSPTTKEVWDNQEISRDSFMPDHSFVILDGEEVAGLSINYYSPEENERHNIDEAWIGILGVRRNWRRRGFATALLNQSMYAFKAMGVEYATLGVDAQSPTGALGVYERVGFETVKRSVAYWKDATHNLNGEAISIMTLDQVAV